MFLNAFGMKGDRKLQRIHMNLAFLVRKKIMQKAGFELEIAVIGLSKFFRDLDHVTTLTISRVSFSTCSLMLQVYI